MSKTEDLSFEEPWPMYDDEDEPWKDKDRLYKLRKQMDTQAEIGDALGCSPATISYWLKKFRKEDRVDEVDDEDLKCRYFSVCGNELIGRNNGVCELCIDLARKADRDGLDLADRSGEPQWMERLHEEYSVYVDNYHERQREREKIPDPECDDCDETMLKSSDLDDEMFICPNCGKTQTKED